MYDSKQDTLNHIYRVRSLLKWFKDELTTRGLVHDQSKLKSPEKEIFDEYTPKLRGVTYGSPEYKEMLAHMKVAIDHHQKNNSHHPEYYENGLDGFDLLDLVEMFADWKAATERHADGDLLKSIEINRERFKMSDQLYHIFKNTAERYAQKLEHGRYIADSQPSLFDTSK